MINDTNSLNDTANEVKPNDLEIKTCVVTSELPAILTKTRQLSDTGEVIISEADKKSTSGVIIKGYATNTTFKNMTELGSFLDTAKHNQALIASTHTASTDTTGIMSTKHYLKNNKPDGFITRTKDNFVRQAGEQGLLILDVDDKSISKDDFMTAIKSVIPNLDDIAYVYTTSSSSYLYNGDTLLQGDKGKRLYIAISDSSDTTRAGQALFDRLWLKGHGYYEIGRAGQFLNRGIIDTAMFKDTCRLDFISGSNCKPPLRQARPKPEINEGRPLDSYTELPELTDTELSELKGKQATARDYLKPQADTVKANYCKVKGIANLSSKGITNPTPEQVTEAERNVNKALDSDELTGDFIITLAQDGRQVTVSEILANPEIYDRLETLDPIEPEYNNYHPTGKLFLDGDTPTLHSFAHGGKYYRLFKQTHFIKHCKGKTATTTKLTLELMQQLNNYYDMGKQLVVIKGGNVIPMNEHLLSYELGTDVQYYTENEDKNGNTKECYIDPPVNVIRQILSMNGQTANGNTQRGLKPLKAVITSPVITPDNHIVYKQGYDAKTQLYLTISEQLDTPTSITSTDEVKQAYNLIMSVIDTFKLNSNLDKSVVLTGFLTAVTRPALDKAPILCLDAPTQGSGKTYLAECIGLLATGQPPAITPAIQGNESEIQKTLLSMLMNGSRVIIWDNIMGAFNSSTMASFVTAINYSGRVLGASEQIELPNKAMVIFTGNNLNLYGDLPRRCITARIDTGEENPLNTKRDLSSLNGLKPDQFIAKNRTAITMACITIIRAYLTSDTFRAGKRYTETRIASFEEWDSIARQPLLHLMQMGIADGLTDIKESIDANMSHDFEKERLEMLIDYLETLFKGQSFTAKDVMNMAFNFTNEPASGVSGELAELLVDMSKGNKPPNTLSTGRILANRVDRIASGMKIVAEQTGGKHAKRYKIIKV